jgi:branched-chain amino acid transport system permease protein
MHAHGHGSGHGDPPSWRGWLIVAVVATVAALLPLLVNFFYVQQAQTLALYIMVAAGLAVAVSYTGLISLGHAALMAAGAYAASYLAVELHLPFPLAALGGIAAAALVGLVLAVPTGRLTHFYFAMVTLGLGLVTEQLLIEWNWTGGYSGITGVPAPALLGVALSQTGFYYLTIVLTGLVLLLLSNLMRSRFGRAFLLVRDDEIAAASAGIRPYSNKLLAFVVSAMPAGLAGALFAYQNSGATPGSFNLNLGLFFLLAVVVGGRNSIIGPIGGVALLFALPLYLREYRSYTNIIFGLILLVVLAIEPGGMAVGARRLLQRARARRAGGTLRAGGELNLSTSRVMPDFVRASGGGDLTITALKKTFGGVRALDDVSVTLRAGQVTALIGANGSGKTTLLNIICGFYQRDSGTIRIGDRDLPGDPASVARSGIGRTFQTPKVLADQSVLENVMAGYAAAGHGTMIEAAIRTSRARRDERIARERALALLDYVGLGGRENDLAGDLPHPHLRFLEIARALIVDPHFLLLDEPAAGLSHDEVAQLDQIVRALAQRGLGVLMIEHNIGLIMGIADAVVVLDSGILVAEGDPARVQAMPEVARIYLGEEWLATQRHAAAQ